VAEPIEQPEALLTWRPKGKVVSEKVYSWKPKAKLAPEEVKPQAFISDPKTGHWIGPSPTYPTSTGEKPIKSVSNPIEWALQGGVMGPAARLVGSAASRLPQFLGAALRGAASMGTAGAVADVSEGQNPIPNLPVNALAGTLLGPAGEAVAGAIAGRAVRQGARAVKGIAIPGEQLESMVAGRVTPAGAIPAARVSSAELEDQLLAAVRGDFSKMSTAERNEAFSAPRPYLSAIIQANRAGIRDRGERMAAASGVLGRRVKSFRDLTQEEVERVGGHFRRLANPETAAEEIANQKSASATVATRLLDRAPTRVGEALEEAGRIYNGAVSAGASRFRQLGPAGEKLADLAEQARVNTYSRIAVEGRPVELMARKFSEKEAEVIFDIMEGAPSNNVRLNDAAAKLSSMLEFYDREATELALPQMSASTGIVHPYQGRTAYAPHVYTESSIHRYSPPAERVGMLRRYKKLPAQIRSGNVQFSRETDLPGYERNAFKAITLYIERTAPRIEQAKILGAKDEVADGLLKEIGASHGRGAEEQARGIYRAFAQPTAQGYSPISGFLRDLSAPIFLTYAGIIQPSQVMLNTSAREGYLNTIKGLAQYAFNPVQREIAIRSGASLHSAVEEMAHSGGVASAWSHLIGLSQADRANRIASGLAASYRATDVGRALAAGKLTPKNLIDAKRLGLSVDSVIQQGGELTQEQSREAMLRGSISTQFLADALSLPLYSRSPWGKVIYLYKSFALNQGRFVKDLVKDARMGHWGPLSRYAATMGTAGMAYGELMRTLRGQPANDSPVWRTIDNLMSVGGLGVFADMMRSVGRNPEAIYGTLTGPIISEAVGTTSDVAKGVRGDWKPIQKRVLRRTVRRIPIIGPEIYEEMKP
jgi:hypothetical protein